MTYTSKKTRMNPQIEESIEVLKKDPLYGKVARSTDLRPSERKQEKQEHERHRITYDLPQELIDAIEAVALEYLASQSRVAALLMILGLESISKGEVNIGGYCEDSRSVRFEKRIKLPTIKPVFIEGSQIYPYKKKSLRSLPDKAEGDEEGDVGE